MLLTMFILPPYDTCPFVFAIIRLLQECGGMGRRRESSFTDFWALVQLKKRYDVLIVYGATGIISNFCCCLSVLSIIYMALGQYQIHLLIYFIFFCRSTSARCQKKGSRRLFSRSKWTVRSHRFSTRCLSWILVLLLLYVCSWMWLCDAYKKSWLQGNFLSTEDLRDLFTFHVDVR